MASGNKFIVAFVEDDETMRFVLTQLIRRETAFAEPLLADSLANGRALLRDHAIDVLVLDLCLPDGDGLELLREIREAELRTRVVVLTGSHQEGHILEAIRLGADGYLVKSDPSIEGFRQQLLNVAQGNPVISREVLESLNRVAHRQAVNTSAASQLTPRELEVVEASAKGLRAKEIASKLGLSTHTVYTHFKNLKAKLGPEAYGDLLRSLR